MKYISTRGGVEPLTFSETVLMGLASDGGLLLPAEIPDVRSRLAAWRRLEYRDLAFEVMRLYMDIPDADLRALVNRSYAGFATPEVTPVVSVGGVEILELFHGPTLAFKDVALQFLGNLFEYALAGGDRELNILAATSGDTGSAAIHGVRGRKGIRIFVMHPHNRVSPVQERQMTTVLDGNVFNIALEGTFDDCQGVMKSIFNDLEFKRRYSLGSVNSINWARILAQIVYYFYAAFRVMDRTGCGRVSFSVPTGNFGDIFAGNVAAMMGLPVSRLILATNDNDILARFFNSGVYSLGTVCATLSPSMDIQVASNFERYLYYRMGSDAAALSRAMREFASTGRLEGARQGAGPIDPLYAAGSADRLATIDTIRRFHRDHAYVLDPHGAVGVSVGMRLRETGVPLICLATAHPAKFAEAVREATSQDVARHPAIDRLMDLPTRKDVLAAEPSTMMRFMADRIDR